MQFLAEQLHMGVQDFNEMTWRIRKELIQFHLDVLERRKENANK